MGNSDKGEVLAIRITLNNECVPMMLKNGKITYEITEKTFSYKAEVDDKVVESWYKVNVRHIHAQLFHELVDRFKLITVFGDDRNSLDKTTLVELRYPKFVECYYYKDEFTALTDYLRPILNRIKLINKHYKKIVHGEPITDEFLKSVNEENVDMFMMTTKPNDVHTLKDQLYILSNNAWYYTPYSNIEINSEEICKKIFKDFENADPSTFSNAKLGDEDYAVIDLSSNRILFINQKCFQYFYKFIDQYEYVSGRKFTEYLELETDIPTKIIYRKGTQWKKN